MQKLIRVKDDKDLIPLRMLLDEGWEIVQSNTMQYCAESLQSKIPQVKAYGGYIDYILEKDET